jgi:hypothetical protein
VVTWKAKNPSNQRTIRTAAINPSIFSSPYGRARELAIPLSRLALMCLRLREDTAQTSD